MSDVLYFAIDTRGGWARAEFPDELITLDYNARGELIGVEAVGSAARDGKSAVLAALAKGRPAVEKALQTIESPKEGA